MAVLGGADYRRLLKAAGELSDEELNRDPRGSSISGDPLASPVGRAWLAPVLAGEIARSRSLADGLTGPSIDRCELEEPRGREAAFVRELTGESLRCRAPFGEDP